MHSACQGAVSCVESALTAELLPAARILEASRLVPCAGTYERRKSNLEIEKLLAEKFPRPDVPSLVAPIATTSIVTPDTGHGSESAEPATAPVEQAGGRTPETAAPAPMQLVTCAVETQQAARPVDSDIRSKVKPLAPGRYYVQFTMGQSAYDKLAYRRRSALHVRQRDRPPMRGHQGAPVRSCRGSRARWRGERG
jgi:hypothetical protein